MIIYGIHPVLSFIKYRPNIVIKVYISQHSQLKLDLNDNRRIKIEYLSPKEIALISKTQDNQGICAEIEDFPYTNINFKDAQTLCILDHIEDPRNLGSIIRNAAAFKINGLIIPKDRTCDITPTVIKASAGTAAFVPIEKVSNINQTVNQIKELGYWVYGFEADGKHCLSEIKFDRKTAFVLGSEGKGISHLTKKLCDFIVNVEMIPEASSLNVSSCAAIVFYQRYIQILSCV